MRALVISFKKSLDLCREKWYNWDVYRSLVSIIQNANIINKFSNLYVEEPARNIAEAIALNNKKIALFDYLQIIGKKSVSDTYDKQQKGSRSKRIPISNELLNFVHLKMSKLKKA